MATLAEELMAQGAQSDYEIELSCAIDCMTRRIRERENHKTKVSFAQGTGWERPTSAMYGSWDKKYKDDIIEHFRKEGMRVSQSMAWGVWDVTVEL